MALITNRKGNRVIYTGTPDEVLTAMDTNPHPLRIEAMFHGAGQVLTVLCWEHTELNK